MRKIFLVAFIGMLLCAQHSLAWGKRGHGLVTEVAFSMLDSATKARVQKYISDMTIEQAGTWMDDIKSDHKYSYMGPWHYVNVDKGETYQPNNDGNIINKLSEAITALQHKDKLSDEEIRKNILLVMHLTGDLHQPLHVGYGIDKGGNEIQVTYAGKGTNLHRVWDSEIIEGQHITLNDCLRRLKNFDKEDMAMLSNINVANWMKQPRSQLNSVYDFKDGIIDDAYAEKNKKIIEEDIAIAGVRLAAILKSAFAS